MNILILQIAYAYHFTSHLVNKYEKFILLHLYLSRLYKNPKGLENEYNVTK